MYKRLFSRDIPLRTCLASAAVCLLALHAARAQESAPQRAFALSAPLNPTVNTSTPGLNWAKLASFDDEPGLQSQTEDALQSDLGEEPLETMQRSLFKGWEFQFTPYLWMAALRADGEFGYEDVSFQKNFCDLLEVLEVGAMARFEGRYDRLGFYIEGMYLNVGNSASVKLGPLRVRGINVNAEMIQGVAGAGGYYRLGQNGRFFDIMAGGRYTYIGTRTSSALPLLDTRFNKHLFDPVIAGRLVLQLSDKWVASLKADIGGFGVGTDLTWGATGFLAYRISKHISLGVGYRYYSLDLDSGSFEVHTQFYGPLVGLTFTF